MARNANRRGVSKKTLIMLLSLVLVIGVAVGGTVAWLVATSNEVTNTFTYGNININLAETTGNDYKIIPGVDIGKNPKVTVKSGSEACYLFVEVNEENWPTFTNEDGTKKVSYAIADGWTQLEGHAGVYYCEVAATDADVDFYVLKDNRVTVSDKLTKTEIDSITTQPKLTFKAYAVQQAEVANVAAAWAIAK